MIVNFTPLIPLYIFEAVSQLCFEFVAAIFRLRKLLEFNKGFSQTKVCGYKKPSYDTPSFMERGIYGVVQILDLTKFHEWI